VTWFPDGEASDSHPSDDLSSSLDEDAEDNTPRKRSKKHKTIVTGDDDWGTNTKKTSRRVYNIDNYYQHDRYSRRARTVKSYNEDLIDKQLKELVETDDEIDGAYDAAQEGKYYIVYVMMKSDYDYRMYV